MRRLPRILLQFLARFPLPALHALGTVLGWAMYGISPTYRRNLKANLALAGYTDARTRRAAIAHAGRMLTETPAIWLRPQHEVAALVREATGVKEALAQRTGGQGAAVPHAAHGLLRSGGAIRLAARADHGALSSAQGAAGSSP